MSKSVTNRNMLPPNSSAGPTAALKGKKQMAKQAAHGACDAQMGTENLQVRAQRSEKAAKSTARGTGLDETAERPTGKPVGPNFFSKPEEEATRNANAASGLAEDHESVDWQE